MMLGENRHFNRQNNGNETQLTDDYAYRRRNYNWVLAHASTLRYHGHRYSCSCRKLAHEFIHVNKVIGGMIFAGRLFTRVWDAGT